MVPSKRNDRYERPARQPSRNWPSSSIACAIGRPTAVPASQAVIAPCWRGLIRYSRARRSAFERADQVRSASFNRWSWRAVAGRLRPTSVAIVDGRRARTARRAMNRRLVGSARSSMPAPLRRGMSPMMPWHASLPVAPGGAATLSNAHVAPVVPSSWNDRRRDCGEGRSWACLSCRRAVGSSAGHAAANAGR
jgi:hypothetical protein